MSVPDDDLGDEEELIKSSWYHRALLGDEFGRVRYIEEEEPELVEDDESDEEDDAEEEESIFFP